MSLAVFFIQQKLSMGKKNSMDSAKELKEMCKEFPEQAKLKILHMKEGETLRDVVNAQVFEDLGLDKEGLTNFHILSCPLKNDLNRLLAFVARI